MATSSVNYLGAMALLRRKNPNLAEQLSRIAQTQSLANFLSAIERARPELENSLPQNVKWKTLKESATTHWQDTSPVKQPPELQKKEKQNPFEGTFGPGGSAEQSAGQKALMFSENDLENALDLEQQGRIMDSLNSRMEYAGVIDENGKLNQEASDRLVETITDRDALLSAQRVIVEEHLYDQAALAEREGRTQDAKTFRDQIEQRRKDDETRKQEYEKGKANETPQQKAKREQQEAQQKQYLKNFFAQKLKQYIEETIIDPKDKHKRIPKYSPREAYRLAYHDTIIEAQRSIPINTRRRVLGSRLDNLSKDVNPLFLRLARAINPIQRKADKEEEERKKKEKKRGNEQDEDHEEQETSGSDGQIRIKRTTETPTATSNPQSKSPGQLDASMQTKIKSNLGGIKNAVNIGQKIAASNPEIWPVIGIVIGVIILIILLALLIWWMYNTTNGLTYKSFDPYGDIYKCTDPLDSLHNSPYQIKNELKAKFFVTLNDFTDLQSPPDQSSQDYFGYNISQIVDPYVYDSLCLLFRNGSVGNNAPNKFEMLFMDYYSSQNGKFSTRTQAQIIQYKLDPGNQTRCYTKVVENDDVAFVVELHNPLYCIDQTQTDPIQQSLQLKFLIAQAFGEGLAQRNAKATEDPKPIFNMFQDVFNGLSSTEKYLPTPSCVNSKKASSCFGDMVGEYLVFPFYLDGTPGSNFVNYLANYPDYYSFAKTNLFNNLEFFSPGSGAGTGIAATSSEIVSHLRTGTWDLHNVLSPNPLSVPTPNNGTYNVSMRPYDSIYWCTYNVMDSYAANGQGDKDIIIDWVPSTYWNAPSKVQWNWNDGNVSILIHFFQTVSGYAYVPADQFEANISRITPGSAIFYNDPTDTTILGYHTGIVQAVIPDSNTGAQGNGIITTTESNNGKTNYSHPYKNWVIQPIDPWGDQIAGFGIKLQ